MGTAATRSPPPPVPIFYTDTFFREYGAASPPPPPPVAEPAEPPAPVASASMDELKQQERNRVLAELREQELGAAEAAAARLGRWAADLQRRQVPCLREQAQVEQCYAAPPGGDQLRCASVVDDYVRCAKL
mmetsp:Transcript_70331/g.199434  ORF Transcript_70331/g.199434 Transcript_70331/m.199434 type:complete len:131 (+) Transcript_70331:71-463(+)